MESLWDSLALLLLSVLTFHSWQGIYLINQYFIYVTLSLYHYIIYYFILTELSMNIRFYNRSPHTRIILRDYRQDAYDRFQDLRLVSYVYPLDIGHGKVYLIISPGQQAPLYPDNILCLYSSLCPKNIQDLHGLTFNPIVNLRLIPY